MVAGDTGSQPASGELAVTCGTHILFHPRQCRWPRAKIDKRGRKKTLMWQVKWTSVCEALALFYWSSEPASGDGAIPESRSSPFHWMEPWNVASLIDRRISQWAGGLPLLLVLLLLLHFDAFPRVSPYRCSPSAAVSFLGVQRVMNRSALLASSYHCCGV